MADIENSPVISPLIMDRSGPIGDSPGDDSRYRLHVVIKNKALEPIPVTVTMGPPGTMRQIQDDALGANTPTDVVELPLLLGRLYSEIGMCVANLQATKYELIWDNNGTETVLESVMVGPGSYTFSSNRNYALTSGAVGTQRFLVRGTVLEDGPPYSDFHASISTLEAA